MADIAALQLALASIKCPNCRGKGKRLPTINVIGPLGGAITSLESCSDCSGSGFLLQGVREKCYCDNGVVHASEDVECRTCQGRGWVPSIDPWKWFEAAQRAGLNPSTCMTELAFFHALAAAVAVRGA